MDDGRPFNGMEYLEGMTLNACEFSKDLSTVVHTRPSGQADPTT